MLWQEQDNFVAESEAKIETDFHTAREKLKHASPSSPISMLLRVEVKNPDGTPTHKPLVWCEGYWFKYQDYQPGELQIGGVNFPFVGDSRVVVFFNPPLSYESLRCGASKNGLEGTGSVWFEDLSSVMIITLDR